MKKHIFIFVLLSGIASAINYAAYPMLGRVLPESQYVNLTVALSLLTQMSTFLSSIIAITIGLTKQSGNTATNTKSIELLQSIVFKLFAGIAILFSLSAPFVMNSLQVPLLFVLPICLMMLVSIPIAVLSGFLNGHKKMIQLGVLTVLSAALQFILGIGVALVTNDGVLAMIAMGLSQIATIALAYLFFRADHLPSAVQALWQPVHIPHKKNLPKLVTYLIVSSVGIMAINLVQIADLLIIKQLATDQVKFYTDMYVISRVVFFGGMIFIWPFLGEINTQSARQNYRPLLKLIGYFVAIALSMAAGLYILGSTLTDILFGVHYAPELIWQFGVLSISYKLSFLVLTAVVLYFIVLHNYKAVALSAIAALAVLGYSLATPPSTTPLAVLYDLNLIAGAAATVSLVLFAKHKIVKR